FTLNAGPARAQSDGQATRDVGTLSHDCTEVTVDYADDANLTREERIARMYRAFQRSLSRFEECQSQRAGTGGAAGTGGGGGTGAGGGTGDGELSGTEGSGTAGSESDGAETSTAASDISGPDAPVDAPSSTGTSTATSDVTGEEPAVTASTTPASTTPNPNGKWTRPDDVESAQAPEDSQASDEPAREATRTQGNGKVPEDIPPADNDSALEAQIRQAAIEETDPELKKRLWDEYRRYKGLPVAK
ncbi:MAG: hypothetical protein HN420_14310, partial [Rhodospirillaceae bacterium]|nr:hypothetical protein [Rhodospirillaceae bacterium]